MKIAVSTEKKETIDNIKRKFLISSIRKALEENIDLLKFWSKITIIVKSNCKDCYGRGHTGFNTHLKRHILCKCLKVYINWGE